MTALVERLLVQFPELQPLYDQHIRDSDELLSYVFLAGVTRFVVIATEDASRLPRLKQLLDFFETELGGQDEEVDALIHLGFGENLLGESHAQAVLRPIMGARLLEIMRHYPA
ncbi:MAG: hypothetical protein ISS15_07295 [Alphaproteobacteria bacterium]|nr:hypothetical protein [Alphaproteobacteria bacterium]MBL7097444.1 hypothetical protein [Alphaproteobacteria bacterium]